MANPGSATAAWSSCLIWRICTGSEFHDFGSVWCFPSHFHRLGVRDICFQVWHEAKVCMLGLKKGYRLVAR